jgi:hypothetical protein
LTADQRHLPEDLARPQLDLPARDRHLDLALGDEIDAVGGITGAEEAFPYG